MWFFFLKFKDQAKNEKDSGWCSWEYCFMSRAKNDYQGKISEDHSQGGWNKVLSSGTTAGTNVQPPNGLGGQLMCGCTRSGNIIKNNQESPHCHHYIPLLCPLMSPCLDQALGTRNFPKVAAKPHSLERAQGVSCPLFQKKTGSEKKRGGGHQVGAIG